MTRRRWLVVALGLLLAAFAAWVLVSWPRPDPTSALPSAEAGSAAEPHADIDEASRERLREVLREEDAREAREREELR